jgi:pimeloyl-ACP methyl ester carboxylesterase
MTEITAHHGLFKDINLHVDDTLTEDLHAAEGMNLDDITLVGFSMGRGEVARDFSLFGPQRIHSVVFRRRPARLQPQRRRRVEQHVARVLGEVTGPAHLLTADDQRRLYGLRNHIIGAGRFTVQSAQRCGQLEVYTVRVAEGKDRNSGVTEVLDLTVRDAGIRQLLLRGNEVVT